MSMPLSQSVTWAIWEGNVYTSFHEKAFLKGLFQLTAAIKKAYTNSSSNRSKGAIARTYFPCCVVVPERARRTFQTCDISDAFFLSNMYYNTCDIIWNERLWGLQICLNLRCRENINDGEAIRKSSSCNG